MSRLRQRLQARLAGASAHVDRLYHLFVELRSELMVAATPPDSWSLGNAQVYDRRSRYKMEALNTTLFAWEAGAVERFFPNAPARVLVGAAGGGRELFALAQRGYQVAGFEPSPELSKVARQRIVAPALLHLERCSYEDLVAGGTPLEQHAPYDAVILGWGSLSHLGCDTTRRALLQTARRLCPVGPLLMSWMRTVPTGPRRAGLRRVLAALGSHRRALDDAYTNHAGFVHTYTEDEIRDLASGAGYEVSFISKGESYPHAVLT